MRRMGVRASRYLHKAEEALLKALAANTDFAAAHLHLGLTYMRWGQNSKALEHWSRAAQIDARGCWTVRSQLLNTSHSNNCPGRKPSICRWGSRRTGLASRCVIECAMRSSLLITALH
jgi:lipopolysaccharide biosynthesis regulator YciM